MGYRAGAIAAATAIVVYLLATGAEILVIDSLRPTETELTWISDAVLAFAFGFAVFLWLNLKSTRMTLSRLERDHIVLDTQISMAASIQRGLLPPVPPDDEGVKWAARLVQAGSIGGDLYDFVRLATGSWLVLVGDVSGKGIPAALVLTSVRTMFRMMTMETSDPGELVERISHRLYDDHHGVPYLTCIVLKIDVAARELAYVNAGHPSGVVFDVADRKRDPLLLSSSGPPAGLFPDQTYQTVSVPVRAGAVCILVTDGITEAFDELGTAGVDPFTVLLAQMPLPLAPDEVCNALIERTAPALSIGEWQDDRTVLAFALNT